MGEDQVGRPWTGPPGITETVAQIVAREQGSGASGRSTREARPARGRPHTPRENPDSPEVTSNGPRTARSGVLAVAPDPGVSFLAVDSTESLYVPPDTMGSVGPTQILIHVNGRVKLFDKTGVLGAINVTDETFWTSVRNGAGVSDPHVEYDRLSGRWFLTAINVPSTGANRILLAVSSGSTITNTSSFTFFQFQHDLVGTTPNADTGFFADYPTLGVDASALYIGVNVFGSSSLEGTTGFVIRKADLLVPQAPTITAFRQIGDASPASGIYTPQGVHNQDPQATEGYFIGVDMVVFSKLVLRRVSNPGGTPSISGNLPVTVPLTTFPIDVPQPTGPLMDGIDDRLFAAMISRGPSGSPTLWTAHNIQVNTSGDASGTGGRDGSRWYQIGSLTTTPALVQSGTLYDSASTTPFSYWMPSIAASGQGHAVLGASRASASAGNGGYASVAVAERLATDPLGTLSPPLLAQSSSSSYDTFVEGTERWGDYSQTVVDPTDNMTFWTFQEYASATNTWGVRVIELEAPPPATPSSASPATIPDEDPSVTVEVTGTSADGSGFFDPGPDTGGPGFANHIAATVDGGVTVNSVTYTDLTHVTLDLSTVGATTGLRSLTVTNPDGQSVMVPNFLTVSADPPRTLTVITDGTGSGTVTATGISCPGDCSEEYAQGEMVNLTATAGPGSSFTGWSGTCSGTVTTCNLTMDTDKSATATFQLLPVLSVSKTGSGGGTVTSTPSGISCGFDCDQSYGNETSVTLTAAPDVNSRFDAWTGCDSTAGNQCTVTVSSNRLVTATFVGTRVLTLTRAGTGSGLVTSAPGGIACGSACTATYDVGTVVTLTAAPASGSDFGSWSGCDSVSGNQCTVTMTAARAVAASFLGPGDDVVLLEGDEGTVSTFGGNDTITVNVHPGMTGLSLTIDAGDGNDVVRISIPPTSCVSVTVVGGAGNDRIGVGNLPTGCSLTVNAGSGNDVIKGGVSSLGSSGRGRLLVNAGPGRDSARGAAGRDALRGSGGRDTLIGAGGADLLVGGSGFDICRSGPGRDRLRSCERSS